MSVRCFIYPSVRRTLTHWHCVTKTIFVCTLALNILIIATRIHFDFFHIILIKSLSRIRTLVTENFKISV